MAVSADIDAVMVSNTGRAAAPEGRPGAVSTTTFLFTDVEGSTRLWETEPERMRPAMARHDALVRAVVQRLGGVVVKMTGDGVHAAFAHAADALRAALEIQLELASSTPSGATRLALRCGLHLGTDEQRDNDYYGPAVNRAARIMSTAHGGQVLLSQAVHAQVCDALPPPATLLDLGVVRLRDLTAPERLYQLLHPQLRSAFPPLRSLASTPNNLPQQLNSFIGRERELAQTRERLRGARLLTLLGMGGLGKSRLSLQLAAELLDEFPDGVWLVELAGLQDAAAVPLALARVLGVQEDAGTPMVEALARYVHDKRLLIVLDNCEHLLAACAQFVKRLLQAGAGLKVLATSRDVLRIAGEVVYQVPALSAPNPNKKMSLDALASHEAVRLFVDRVQAVRPDFVLTADNAAAVTEICHRLDGIALALELAAARARALSVQNIAARLSDRFRLLASGDQTVLPRQRTLRALIDWSYELLSAPERAFMQRLAVFAGGWTLEAAEAVCAGGGILATEVLDLQTQLVEKSLVLMQAEGARYRMLDTVRAYAHEQLVQNESQARQAQRQHLNFFLALAEAACPLLGGAQQGDWPQRLDAENENLLAAHAGAEHEDEAELGLRLVFSLRPYWIGRGHLSAGQRACEELLARPGLQARNLLRCRALAGAGQMCFFTGQDAQARAHLTEALAIAREHEDQSWVARILQPLGMACLGEGDLAAARAHLAPAVALARELGDARELLAALNALAMLHRLEGALSLSETLYHEALTLARAQRDQESVAIVLLNLAMVQILQERAHAVPTLLREVIDLARASGSLPVGRSALEVAAGLAAAQARWPQAATLYGAAQAQMEHTGLRRDPADEAFLAPLMARVRIALGVEGFNANAARGAALALDVVLVQVRDGVAL